MIGVIAWMHTFSPAKMWIAGLDALRKPLLHLHTQANVELPWADIDFDFMNLNQAAHGDREFGYIQTRLGVARKTVVGHVSDPTVLQQVEDWQRAAAGWAAARSLKLARFGDNMRYVAVTEGDKTEAELRFGVQVNTWGVNELAAAVGEATDRTSTRWSRSTSTGTTSRQSCCPAVSGTGRCATVPPSSSACGRSWRPAASAPFTTSFEDLGALKQLPGLAVQRLMAEGYGFGAEGDWKTAILVRVANVMGVGLPGGASLMEDYTYDLVPGHERILGAHMLEVSPSLTTARPAARDPPARHRRQGRPGASRLHRRPRPRRRRRAVRPARPFPAGRQRRRERRGSGPAAPSGRPSGLAAGAGLRHLSGLLARRGCGPPHRHDDRGRHRRLARLRRDRQDRARRDRRVDHGRSLPARAAVEPGVLPSRPRILTRPVARDERLGERDRRGRSPSSGPSTTKPSTTLAAWATPHGTAPLRVVSACDIAGTADSEAKTTQASDGMLPDDVDQALNQDQECRGSFTGRGRFVLEVHRQSVHHDERAAH